MAYTGTKWGHGVGTTVISWSFASLPGDLIDFTAAITQSAYRSAVTAAFDAWEAVANIDFVQQADSRSNDIRLGWSDIDGRGGTLGTAYWTYRGSETTQAEIEFDRSEYWAPQSGGSGTVNFYAVALHEIGHAIGLSHESGDRSSIMYPYLTSNAALSDDDIADIQGLYGAPVIANATPDEPVSTVNAMPEDAGTSTVSSDVFRFYNAETGVHFYTASAGERDAVIAGLPQFQYEGSAFEVPLVAWDLSFYRFYNAQTGAHFYTASEAERDAVLSRDLNFTLEGPAFKAYADEGANGDYQALYRFLRLDTGTHFYTASEAEKVSVETSHPQYRYEGIAYYVDIA